MKPIAYLRVSKKEGMTTENQRIIIESWLKGNSIPLDGVLWLEDRISTREDRPEQDRAYNLILSKAYDTLLCVRIDRWGRSLPELVTTVRTMVDIGARVIFINSGMDLSTANFNASSRLQFNLFSAFAEYERDTTQERTLEGLERARLEGKRLGRPPGSRDKNPRRKAGYNVRWDKLRHPENYAK